MRLLFALLLFALLLFEARADEWEHFEEALPEQHEHTNEQDVVTCTKTSPCWEYNLTACFELHTRSCWTYHAEADTFPCTQADPCCADELCWFRHAPEKGIGGNGFFSVRRVVAAASALVLPIYIAYDSVVGVTLFEYFKLLVLINVLLLLSVPQPWFYALCIPFYPHPASSLKSLLACSKMVIFLVGFKRLELVARIVFGANWRDRMWRLAQVPRAEGQGNEGDGAEVATREQPMNWPPPLRVAESVAARLLTDLAPPESFVCPLTHDLMREPTVTPRGTTYEREALTRWITVEGRYPSQEANGKLGVEQLAPNLAVRNLIEVWLQEQKGEAGQGKTKKRPNAKQAKQGQ